MARNKKTKPAADRMSIEWMSPSAIVPYQRNPRHNLQAIDKVAASLKEFDWRQPIVVDRDMVVVVGHTRLMAAQRLGMKSVPVHIARDLTPEQAKAYRIADNRTGEESEWDKELLALELEDLRSLDVDLALTAFSPAEIDELLSKSEERHRTPDPDAVKPVPKNPRSRLGDVWILGKHRLVCGDSRRVEDVRRATDNHLADIIWTDPPYNVAYSGKGKGTKHLKIKNDAMSNDSFLSFLLVIMRTLHKMTREGAPIYVAHSDTEGLNFRQAFVQAGFKLSGCLIWRKDSMVLGRSDYQWQHEPILYGWKPGASHQWFGGRKEVTMRDVEGESLFSQLSDGSWQISLGNEILRIRGDVSLERWTSSIIEESRPTRSGLHPTMKPTALIERMLKNSAKPGMLVLDVFGGSGSTMIAAERLGMRSALVELDPAYCDVIVDRWQEYTGGRAYREGEKIPRLQSSKKKSTSPREDSPRRSKTGKNAIDVQKNAHQTRKNANAPAENASNATLDTGPVPEPVVHDADLSTLDQSLASGLETPA